MSNIKILLQAGHENIVSGQTGAPLEKEKNIRIRNRLGQILIEKGFQVFLCDAKFTSNEDFDLALAMHCDANYAGDEGGGFVDYPSPDVDDNNAESKRIKEAIESEYFKHSGIRNMPNRSNPNTKYYYWWSMLSSKTPCVIIEMGESIDPHDSVLLNDTERIANSIARGICKAFNVPFDVIVPPNPCEQVVAELDKANKTISSQNELLIKREVEISNLTTSLNKQSIKLSNAEDMVISLTKKLNNCCPEGEMSPVTLIDKLKKLLHIS